MVLLVVQPGIESRISLETDQIWFDMKFGYLLYTSYAHVLCRLHLHHDLLHVHSHGHKSAAYSSF